VQALNSVVEDMNKDQKPEYFVIAKNKNGKSFIFKRIKMEGLTNCNHSQKMNSIRLINSKKYIN